MKLCWMGIHKFARWRTPRNNIQSRECIYCGLYQRRIVVVECDPEEWAVKPMFPEDDEVLSTDGIVDG